MLSRRFLSLLPTLFSLVFVGHAPAQSSTVNADFNGKLYGTPGPNYVGQGGNPNSGTSWNDVQFPGSGDASAPTFTTGALTASDGTTLTAITLTLHAPYNYYAELFGTNPNIASNAHALMSDWIDGGGNGNYVTIDNLKPSTPYSFYLYGTGVNGTDNPSGSSFTVGGVTQNTFNPGGDHILTEGIDYTVFASVFSDADGTVRIDYTHQFAGLGFTEMSVVPEASTGLGASIFVAGLAGIMIRRRARARG